MRRSYMGLTHPLCRTKYGINEVKSIFAYEGIVKKIIKQIKYRYVYEACDEFLRSISLKNRADVSFFGELTGTCELVPVPLHPARAKERGFNQSLFIVRFFSRLLHFPVSDMVVSRVKNTKPQVECRTREERVKNVKGAFSLSLSKNTEAVKGKNYIIVDDVWTTGSTLKEIGTLLKHAGAAKIFALTIAHGVSQR